MSIEASIREFIVNEGGGEAHAGQLTDDFPLLEAHVLDSMGIFDLVTHLEQRYGVEIFDEELVPENFGTVAAIARLVESKRGAGRT